MYKVNEEIRKRKGDAHLLDIPKYKAIFDKCSETETPMDAIFNDMMEDQE